MMKQNRYIEKVVEQYDDGYPPDDAAGCVAWFVNALNEIPEPYRAEATITIGSYASYDMDYGRITVSYTRPETDDEEAAREAEERAEADRKREAELRQLAALMDKYGKAPQ